MTEEVPAPEPAPSSAVVRARQERRGIAFVRKSAIGLLIFLFGGGVLGTVLSTGVFGPVGSFLGILILGLITLFWYLLPVLILGTIVIIFFVPGVRRALLPVPGTMAAPLTATKPSSVVANLPPRASPAHGAPAARAEVELVPSLAVSDAQFAADVAALARLRADAVASSRRRLWLFVPAAIVLAGLLTFGLDAAGTRTRGSPVLGFAIVAVVFAVCAWWFATGGPAERYATAFKTQLLPRLLAPYGDFQFSPKVVPPTARLVEVGIVSPAPTRVTGDDEIAGTYRGRRLRLNEVELVHRRNKTTRTLFQGLLIALSVEPRFAGTLVVRDAAVPDGPARPMAGLSLVNTHDPAFDEHYQVLASDAPMARALLSEANRARLLHACDDRRFKLPYLLAEDDFLLFAVPREHGVNLFDPPTLDQHDIAEQVASLEADVLAVFRLIETLAGLEHRAAPPPASERPSAADMPPLA